MRATFLRVFPLVAALTGCGGNVDTPPGGMGGGTTSTSTGTTTSSDTGTTTSTSTGTTTSTTSTTTSTTTTSTTTSTTTTSTTTTPPGDCASLADAIAANMKGVQSCTATVRLDFTSKAILGFAVQCAPYSVVDEAAARARAQADTGQGQSGQLLGTPPPEDEWVFWQAAGDFGGSAAVSTRTGLSVFGGTTVWSGLGDITYPTEWQPPGAIGEGCGGGIMPAPARGFDLASGMALDDAAVDAALAVAWDTAIPEGLAQGGYLFDAMVLRYPRSVGAFDPGTAEWIVLINSGWLE